MFDRLVTKGAHSEHDAASLLREVVHAVAYLHGHSIIHFDIKPENILVSESPFFPKHVLDTYINIMHMYMLWGHRQIRACAYPPATCRQISSRSLFFFWLSG